MQFRGSVKRKTSTYIVFFVIILYGTGCNLLPASFPAFLIPSDSERKPTPNWAATIEAAVPPTAGPVGERNPESSPVPEVEVAPPPTPTPIQTGPILYYSQAGDTLLAISVRFGVNKDEITSPIPIPESGFINPNQLLIIPNRLANTTIATHVLPDSEFVFSLSAADFDIQAYVNDARGYLAGYH